MILIIGNAVDIWQVIAEIWRAYSRIELSTLVAEYFMRLIFELNDTVRLWNVIAEIWRTYSRIESLTFDEYLIEAIFELYWNSKYNILILYWNRYNGYLDNMYETTKEKSTYLCYSILFFTYYEMLLLRLIFLSAKLELILLHSLHWQFILIRYNWLRFY